MQSENLSFDVQEFLIGMNGSDNTASKLVKYFPEDNMADFARYELKPYNHLAYNSNYTVVSVSFSDGIDQVSFINLLGVIKFIPDLTNNASDFLFPEPQFETNGAYRSGGNFL